MERKTGRNMVIDHRQTLENHLRNKTPTIVYGNMGTGKTTFVKQTISEIDFKYKYYSCSNKSKEWFKGLIKQVLMKTKDSPVFVLDDVQDTKETALLIQLINSCQVYALVFITTEYWKLPKKFQERVAKIEIKKQFVNAIKKIVEAELKTRGIKLDRKKITRNLKTSLQASIYGGEPFDELNGFNITREVFAKKISNFTFKDYGIWITENAIDLLNGRKLYEAIQVIETAYNLDEKEVLLHLPEIHGNINYPEFFRMRKGRKNGND